MATDVELAWAAGLIDGEGHVSIHLVNKKRRPYLRPVIKVAMTEREPLLELQRIFGRGSINGPYSNGHSNFRTSKPKPIWHWGQVFRQALDVATQLLPYAVVKHKAFQEIIIHYEESL